MLLGCFCLILHAVNCILMFIENHPISVGIVTTVITSSVWLRNFLGQKRAEAFLGFYSRLLLTVKDLRKKLEEDELLKPDDRDGNIFSMIYTDECKSNNCPGFSDPTDEYINLYQAAAKRLEEILMNSENNVYPLNSDKLKWNESLYVLFSFCEFLENIDHYKNRINVMQTDDGSEAKHVIRCRELIEAMDYIEDSINGTEY